MLIVGPLGPSISPLTCVELPLVPISGVGGRTVGWCMSIVGPLGPSMSPLTWVELPLGSNSGVGGRTVWISIVGHLGPSMSGLTFTEFALDIMFGAGCVIFMNAVAESSESTSNCNSVKESKCQYLT